MKLPYGPIPRHREARAEQAEMLEAEVARVGMVNARESHYLGIAFDH